MNSNIFDDLSPIKVVSYLSSFFFLLSITSEKSLNKLQKKGISGTVLNDLAELKDKVYSSKESFLNRVKKLPQAQEILKYQDELLKTAKGFFRLDRLIPNRTIREWTEALIFAVVVATIVRTYFFAPFCLGIQD